ARVARHGELSLGAFRWFQRFRRRLGVMATITLAIGMLAVAVAGTIRNSRAAALDGPGHAVRAEAAFGAVAFGEYFERAQSINLLLAHDSVFTQLAPGRRAQAGAPGRAAVSAEAGAAMAYLQRLYPGRISEACLIDSTGTEIARVVRGVVAP